MRTEILQFIHAHKTELFGVLGASITGLAPYMETLGFIGQTMAGIGGFIIMSLTIYIKWKEAKKIYKQDKE